MSASPPALLPSSSDCVKDAAQAKAAAKGDGMLAVVARGDDERMLVHRPGTQRRRHVCGVSRLRLARQQSAIESRKHRGRRTAKDFIGRDTHPVVDGIVLRELRLWENVREACPGDSAGQNAKRSETRIDKVVEKERSLSKASSQRQRDDTERLRGRGTDAAAQRWARAYPAAPRTGTAAPQHRAPR